MSPSIPPIGGLPVEILLAAISIVIIAWKPTRIDPRYRQPWLMLRSVCRLWHEAIDGNPAFWTEIIDPLSDPYVSLVLRNSSPDRPLSLIASLYNRHTLRLSNSLLHPPNHISELHLTIEDTIALNRFLAVDFPRIREVHLSRAPELNTHVRTLVPLHESFHGARTLFLRDVELPMSSIMQCHALRLLTLSYTDDHSRFKLPITSVLDMLRHQRHLEYLSISTPFTATSYEAAIPRIDITSLTTLRLSATVIEAAIFLPSLRLPHLRHLDLSLHGILADDSFASTVFTEARELCQIVGLFPSVIKTGPPLDVVVIECEDGDTSFRLESVKRFRTLARHVDCIVRSFGGQGIRTLELNSECNIPYFLQEHLPFDPLDCWVDLLTLLPNVSDIVVSGVGDAVENLPTALGLPSPSGAMLCLRLTHLTFANGGFRTRQCQAWSSALSRRKARGDTLSRLTFSHWTLPWDFWLNHFEERCDHVQADNVEEYRYFEDQDGSDED